MQFSVSLPSRAAKRARKAPQDARVSGGSSESAQDARRSPERITRASMPSGEGTTARYDDSSDGYARTRVARRASPRASCKGEQLRGYPKRGDCREPGAARHLPVAARVRRSARRARTTQKARHARAAPRARRRSARPRRRSARSRHEKERGSVVPAPTLARDARERGRRAPKHEREERDGKVSLRRERRTCGVGAGARTVCL